ncbi:MAG: nucleoside triphosphate pyrophosphatase [Candidatus Binatia bacterium]
MQRPLLVLASGSPRRRELLGQAGFEFEIDVADIDESIHEGESPVAATVRLAIEKAEAVVRRRAASRPPDAPAELVLAADTTVVIGERILGKPANPREAADMLMSLAGRNHLVLTAWALLPASPQAGQPECGITRSTVRMREIARSEAEAYAATGEPMDKAGAYAAQGEGRRFIGAIAGPLDNVIGLPMAPVVAALSRGGIVPG